MLFAVADKQSASDAKERDGGDGKLAKTRSINGGAHHNAHRDSPNLIQQHD